MSLPFPLSWRWTILVEAEDLSMLDPSQMATTIERALIAERATSVIREENKIRFECKGITGMDRFAVLAPISRGVVEVHDVGNQLRIAYTLEFILLFWISILAAILFWLFDTYKAITIEAIVPFVWLFGGNIAITLWRFPRFIRRVVKSSNMLLEEDKSKGRTNSN